MRMRGAIVVGAVLAGWGASSGQAAPLGQADHLSRSPLPPIGTPAQIRLNAPVPQEPSRPGAPAGGGTVEALTPDLALDLANQMGIEKAEKSVNDDKTTSIFGQANGVPVEMSLGECPKECDSNFTLYAKFGQQPTVDAVFANRFNLKNGTMLSIQNDGSVTLSYTLYMDGGVTPKHIVAVGEIFLASIKTAANFKP